LGIWDSQCAALLCWDRTRASLVPSAPPTCPGLSRQRKREKASGLCSLCFCQVCPVAASRVWGHNLGLFFFLKWVHSFRCLQSSQPNAPCAWILAATPSPFLLLPQHPFPLPATGTHFCAPLHRFLFALFPGCSSCLADPTVPLFPGFSSLVLCLCSWASRASPAFQQGQISLSHRPPFSLDTLISGLFDSVVARWD
jgi:hypothetical protein